MEPGHEAIEDQADGADPDNAQNDVGDIAVLVGIPDKEADSRGAGHHNFGGDDGEPGQANGDAQAGEDVGQG